MLKFKFLRLALLSVVVGFLFAGCDLVRGKDGARGVTGPVGPTGPIGATGPGGQDGESALVSSKTYIGTPTSNPFTVSCPEIVDLSRQVISVYAIKGSDASLMALPVSHRIFYEYIYNGGRYSVDASMHHSYEINGQNIILYSSIGEENVPVALTVLTVINDTTGEDTYSEPRQYRIDIKTFSTVSGAMAYKKSISNHQLDTTSYDSLLFGREL